MAGGDRLSCGCPEDYHLHDCPIRQRDFYSYPIDPDEFYEKGGEWE